MKRIRRILLVWIGCLFLGSVFAQNALRIRLDSASLVPTSIDTGNSFPLNVWIINDSNTVYNGVVSFSYLVNSTAYSATDTTSSGIQYTSNPDSIGAHDSIILQLIVHATGPVFTVGPSVVVIWPVAFGAAATDSLQFSFTVTHPALGIAETDNKRLRLFVNDNSLYIEKDPEIQLNRVRIYDVTGRTIADRSNPADNIPLPEMNTGLYMAEANYNNNQRKFFRFYR